MRNLAVVGLCVLVFAAVAAGQGSTRQDGSMEALVNEIRALRADLNRVAGANIRAQLLFGRLQLQEQRTITLSRQLDTIQEQLTKTTAQRAELEDRLKELEESPPTQIPLEERQGMERSVRRELTSLQAREQQLRQQQSSLSAAVADEQARWTDFSSRLDELERALIESRR
jgi:septal ring factor EnvC (AmiA/AmiB activator)